MSIYVDTNKQNGNLENYSFVIMVFFMIIISSGIKALFIEQLVHKFNGGIQRNAWIMKSEENYWTFDG